MQNIFRHIKDQQEYEARLAEYAKPFKPMLDVADSFWEKYSKYIETAGLSQTLSEKCISNFFYWQCYARYMVAEILIPLARTSWAIFERQGFMSLFDDENAELEDFAPATFSDAFEFFRRIDIIDAKQIIERWSVGMNYVSLIDAIENDNRIEFISKFKELNHVENKLRSLRLASNYFKIFKLGAKLNSIFDELDTLEEHDPVTYHLFAEIFVDAESVERHDWRSFEDLCNVFKPFVVSVMGQQEYETLLHDSFLRDLYENVVFPLIQINDCSNKSHIEKAIQHYSNFGPIKEFYRFWKDLSDIGFAYMFKWLQLLGILNCSTKEKHILASIIDNPNNHIPSTHLHSIIRLVGRVNSEQKTPTVIAISPSKIRQSKFDKIRQQGMPYFEVAMRKGLISVNGEFFIWHPHKVLLTYLCGRIYCGDEVEQPRHKNQHASWICGVTHFPEKDLDRMFGVKNLGQQRRNNKSALLSAPEGYELIDEIINEVRNIYNT